MKKNILLGLIGIVTLSLTACSNDEKINDDGTVNLEKAVEFNVSFADYNDDQEVNVTRTNSKELQNIDLGNGIYAKCTLERDTAKQSKSAATRVIPYGTYTMLAYDANDQSFKGEINGTVNGNKFTPAGKTSKSIKLAPGTYDFVLFNNKVTRSGNNLTVSRNNANYAFIGRTRQVISGTPYDQQVSFTLKHAGAKIKIKFIGYMPCSGVNATISSVNSTDVPGSSVYDASTGQWSAGPGAALSEGTTYPTGEETVYRSLIYGTTSNEEIMLTPTTDVSKLKLTFTSGSIYNQNMSSATPFTFNPGATLKLEQNGSYVLNVNLMYQFLYLMSDGSRGFYGETTFGGGSKTPIAVVLSQSQRMAIALKDANGGAPVQWCDATKFPTYTSTQYNTGSDLSETLTNPNSGWDETWNPAFTHSNVTGEKIRGKRTDFYAFKAAADYNTGVIYTGSPALQWYLPSMGDWKWAYSALGLGDKTQVTQAFYSYFWYGKLAEVAFNQVGGTPLEDDKFYFTSTEFRGWIMGIVRPRYVFWDNTKVLEWHNGNKTDNFLVRPFVRY